MTAATHSPGRDRARAHGGTPGIAVCAVVCSITACAPQAAGTRSGSTAGEPGTVNPQLAIAPDQPLGWIAIAPRASEGPGDWIPVDRHTAIVATPAEGLPAGAALQAIDTAGRVARVAPAGAARIAYGCDNHQLDVAAYDGDPLAPGAVWLLPPGAPASWTPRPLAIAVGVEASAARRRDTVGPLALELRRRDASHGTLAIERGGRVVHTAVIERGEMAGADPSPLDLQAPGVAIPAPVAAWSLGERGPVLLVLETPSYEGEHLTAFLVERDRAREQAAMAVYLYRCAF